MHFKSIQKIATLTFILTLGFGGYSLAHDCALVSKIKDPTEIATFSFVSQLGGLNYEGVLPKEALAKALENLKKYCCTSNILNSDDEIIACKAFKGGKLNYPESAYLYDHLIDVSFRRLDGRVDLAYGLSVDKKGADWRELATKFATAKVETSKVISDAYIKDRTRKDIVVTDKDLTTFIASYNSATLADKYANMCPIIDRLYTLLRTDKEVVIDPSYSKGFHAKCLKLANERINKEYVATQALMIKASNESLHTVTQAYTMKYFMQEKMAALLSTINVLRGLFSSLVQQAPVAKSASK